MVSPKAKRNEFNIAKGQDETAYLITPLRHGVIVMVIHSLSRVSTGKRYGHAHVRKRNIGRSDIA